MKTYPYRLHEDFRHAARAFEAAHSFELIGGPGSAVCPACESHSAFGASIAGGKWICFSTRHPTGVGRPSKAETRFFGA